MGLGLSMAGCLLSACSADSSLGGSEAELRPETAAKEIRISVGASNVGSGTRSAITYDLDRLKTEANIENSPGRFHIDAWYDGTTDKFIDDNYVSDMRSQGATLADPWWMLEAGSFTRKTYYWPGNLAVNFFAYMPLDQTGISDRDVETGESVTAATGIQLQGGKVFTYTDRAPVIKIQVPTADNQKALKEFIYAYAEAQNQEANGEAGVALTFQHPLSAIYLKVNSAFDKMKLLSVTFKNICTSGTGTCGTGSTAWEYDATSNTDFTITVNKTMGDDLRIGRVYENPILMLPQPLTSRTDIASDATAVIRYQKWDESAGALGSVKEVELSMTNTVKTWESGKAYIYSLELGTDDSAIIGATVEDWIKPYGDNEQTILLD